MNQEIGAAQGVEYGVCRYCGQMKTLAVPMPTQEEADELATETCSCDPAKAVRRRKRESTKLFSRCFLTARRRCWICCSEWWT